MGRLLLLLLPMLQLQAGTGFLLPIGRSRTTRTQLFSSYATPTASSPIQSQQQQHEAQKDARLRFEGFCPEEGAAAGDTITVVYDPRAPGIGSCTRVCSFPIPTPCSCCCLLTLDASLHLTAHSNAQTRRSPWASRRTAAEAAAMTAAKTSTTASCRTGRRLVEPPALLRRQLLHPPRASSSGSTDGTVASGRS